MKIDALEKFKQEKEENISEMAKDGGLIDASQKWLLNAAKYKYGYNFTWMGCPIIQLPADIIAIQELIWRVKPDVIIETGIAFGGSLIFSASMLTLLGNSGKVIGIDIDLREHNRAAIKNHPMSGNIILLEGSSIDETIVSEVESLIAGKQKVMVFLDSNHTHEHVLKELEIYSKYISEDSYIVVFDTSVDLFPEEYFLDRPWSPGNSPMSAVKEFLKHNHQFISDREFEAKLLITSCPNGFLKKVRAEQ